MEYVPRQAAVYTASPALWLSVHLWEPAITRRYQATVTSFHLASQLLPQPHHHRHTNIYAVYHER